MSRRATGARAHAAPAGRAARPGRIRLSIVLRADGTEVRFENILGRRNLPSTPPGYTLTCRGAQTLDLSVRRADGGEMDVETLEFQFTCPLLNFSRVILPDSGREFMFKERALFLRAAVSGVSAPNDGMPFVAFVDQVGQVSASFGLVSHFGESDCRCLEPRISARKALLGGADEATLAFRAPAPGWRYGRAALARETVFLGGRARSWFHALRAYSRVCRAAHRARYPANPAALEPTWCTWTAWCSDRMTTDAVLANARVARRLGIGAIILDDGWFGPGLDTDDRPLNIGDYHPDPAKFADLPALVAALRAMGLKTLLWYAPTCIAAGSRAFAAWRAGVITHQGKPVAAPSGFFSLCPCNPRVRDYISGEIVRMMRDYGIDGFKVDLYNALPATPCDAAHPHDTASMVEGLHRLMRDIWRAALARNPDALMELKQNYGNVIAAQYGTMVRAGDTAYDIDTNLLRCFYIQACAPVAHNDYLACGVHEAPRDIGIMMVKMLTAGVPTFSMDLPRQPRGTLEVIAAWLAFYRGHRDLFARPREPLNARLDVWRMGTRARPIVSAVMLAVEVDLAPARETWLLNGTGRRDLVVRTRAPLRAAARFYDHALRRKASRRLTLRDGDRLPIVPGGAVQLSMER